MKKLFVALMLVLLVSSFSFAQINKGWDGTKPEVYKGSKSIYFMYTPFQSDLSGVNAGSYSYYDALSGKVKAEPIKYGIGFQYYVTSNIALAIGFGMGMSSQTGVDSTQNDYSENTLGVNLEGNYHFKSLYGISPYLGLNVNFGTYSWSKTTKTATSIETKTTGSSIGGGLNLGFDWYFTPGLSLGGRYTLGFRMLTAPETTVGSQAPVKDPDASWFGTGVASFILNVHL